MNKFLSRIVIGTVGSVGFVAQAQVSLGVAPYEQSFDSLALGLPAGWTVRTGASGSALGVDATFATGAYNWSGTGAGFHNYASTQGLDAGATSAAQAASSDRALGIRQSAAFGDPGAAFVLQIAGTAGYRDLAFAFDFALVDEEGRSVTWTADYALGANPSSFTSLGTFTRATWGSQPAQFTLPAGVDDQSEDLWIRLATLEVSTGSGSRDSFAVDDFRLTATPVPEPAEWASFVSASLLAAGLWRHRRSSR